MMDPADRFGCFDDKDQLLKYAEFLLFPRVDALYRDVMLCSLPHLSTMGIAPPVKYKNKKKLRIYVAEAFGDLRGSFNINMDLIQNSLFPPILFCCASLEMFSELFAQDKHHADDKKVRDYSREFLRYPEDHFNLFWKLYRGGLAHSGAPHPIEACNKTIAGGIANLDRDIPRGSLFTWALSYGAPDRHMKITVDHKRRRHENRMKDGFQIDYKLSVDIPRLTGDIIRSVISENGYFSKLRTDHKIRQRFDRSIERLVHRKPTMKKS